MSDKDYVRREGAYLPLDMSGRLDKFDSKVQKRIWMNIIENVLRQLPGEYRRLRYVGPMPPTDAPLFSHKKSDEVQRVHLFFGRHKHDPEGRIEVQIGRRGPYEWKVLAMSHNESYQIDETRSTEIYSMGDYRDPKKINPCTGKPYKCYRTEQDGMGPKRNVPCPPKKGHKIPPHLAKHCATPQFAPEGIDRKIPSFARFFTESSVVEYLQMLQKNQKMKGMAYTGPADFILKHGTQYKSAKLTSEEMDILKRVLDRQCSYKPKQCFYNAQSIGLGGEIGYVEGIADSIGLPMEHAWNTINGKVIDMTWRMNNDGQPIIGVIPEGWEYFGVQLPNKMINKMWGKSGLSHPMISDWEGGFPLLKQAFE